jgi:hypothetical protein
MKETEPIAETSWTDNKWNDDQCPRHQSKDLCRLTLSSEVICPPIWSSAPPIVCWSWRKWWRFWLVFGRCSDRILVGTLTIPKLLVVFLRQENAGAVPQISSLPLPSASSLMYYSVLIQNRFLPGIAESAAVIKIVFSFHVTCSTNGSI